MLVGVGLGPGDPELLTIRAVRLLREADAVFVPGKVAERIVAPYCNDVTVLSFPMTDDEDYIRACMEKNADLIAPSARNGLAVFGILGDPNFYGTYSRLCDVLGRRYPEIPCTTVPGISSITAFASVAGLSVAGGLCVTDGSPLTSQIRLKVKHPRVIAEHLKQEGYQEFVLVERMYMDDEKIYLNDELPETCHYFSVMFARR